MFKKNVYSRGIKEAIDTYHETAKKLCGWLGDDPSDLIPYPIYNWTAPKEMIIHQATIADYKNPLHRDEAYARETRWGGLIAAPFYLFCIAGGIPSNMVRIPPEDGTCLSVHMGEGFEELTTPIRPGDSFKIWIEEGALTDLTPEGDQEEMLLQTHERLRIYNQRDELVGILTRTLVSVIGAPGLENKDVLRINCGNFTGENLRFTEEKKYTMDEINSIESFYFNEKRQGKAIRFWEDVSVGDTLYPIELGPITPWETIMTMATFGCVPAPVWHIKEKTPSRIFYDPVSNIPHKNIEFHLDPAFARKIGIPHFYSSTLIQNSIFDFFGRLLSNWMGDDGQIRNHQWIKFTNTPFGDTLFGYGRVVRKYIDASGHCLVDIDCWMDNARGFISNTGFSTVELLSREKMNRGKLPEWADVPLPDPNPLNFRIGERVRIRPRNDWPLPTPHPTAGHTAVITEFHPHKDLGGYCFIQFDEDITGVDPRVAVGMRLDQLEML